MSIVGPAAPASPPPRLLPRPPTQLGHQPTLLTPPRHQRPPLNPPGFASHQDGATPGCAITITCPAGGGPWHGWAIGSTSSPSQHLIITASPQPLRNYAKAVNGPGWYRKPAYDPLLG